MGRASTTPFLFVLALVGACTETRPFEGFSPDTNDRFEGLDAGVDTLFGRPNDGGISKECCMPTCLYHEDGVAKTWTAPVYTKEDLQALHSNWKLAEPWPVFEGNEFKPPLEADDSSVEWVCAVLPRPELKEGVAGPMPYDLENYPSRAEAEEAGAMVTHRGKCGACSSLRNLTIYIAKPNLTEPIRECGATGLIDRDLSRLACIASLGFDLPCAQAWDINTRNTQKECLKVCGTNLKTPSNTPYECNAGAFLPTDIKLVNACLACDEAVSLELFRAAAGRSRRGSGLPSPICRRCDGVYRVEHYYPQPEP